MVPQRSGEHATQHATRHGVPRYRASRHDALKIGISACFFHADPERPIFTGKTLQYVEQSMAHWVMSEGRAGR